MIAPEPDPAITLRQTCTPPAVVAILLAEAKRKGVSLVIEGDRLRVRGPRTAESLVRALSARKAEVLVALSRNAAEVAEAGSTNFTVAPPPSPNTPKPAGPGASGFSAAPTDQAATGEPTPLAVPNPPAGPAIAPFRGDARQTGTVVTRDRAPAPRPLGPLMTSSADLPLDPEPELLPPDPEFLALVAEGRELAAHEHPMWSRELDRQVAWNDLESLRKCLNGLREMARLRADARNRSTEPS